MECEEWQGARSAAGYGQVWRDGQARYVHREVWIAANGPIPDGMLIMHSCDNPPCCLLAHLRLGTYADNARDAWEKRRMSPPPPRPRRFTTDEAARLREEGLSYRVIAARLGVTPMAVHRRLSRRPGTVRP